MNRTFLLVTAFAGALALAAPAVAEEAAKAKEAQKPLKMEESDHAPTLPIGSKVPDFQLKDADGKEYDLDAYRGDGIVVVTFLSGKCPVAHALVPHIAEAAKTYGAKGVKFLGIMSNSTEKTGEVTEVVRKQGIEFPVLDDPGNAVADELDAIGTPHMFVIDKAGILRYSGAFCDNWKEMDKAEKFYFRDALDAVLAGKDVAVANPDAFIGCSIKRVKTTG